MESYEVTAAITGVLDALFKLEGPYESRVSGPLIDLLQADPAHVPDNGRERFLQARQRIEACREAGWTQEDLDFVLARIWLLHQLLGAPSAD